MIRTGYSFKFAVGHLNDVLVRLKDLRWTQAPICDVNSTFGFVNWTKLCKQHSLVPIYGVELHVAPALGEKRPIVDRWKFLATNELRPLHNLIAKATANPGREPSLTYTQALSAGGLIKITGERVLLDHINPKLQDLYIGLSPALPKATYNQAKKLGCKFVAISDNVYPTINDKEFYRITLGRRSSTQTYPQHILSDDEWHKSIEWFTDKPTRIDAIKHRNNVLLHCNAQLKTATLLVPEKPKTLRAMCIEGAVKKKIDLSDPVYKERLDREINLIAEKKFEDYFYIIADLVTWAKRHMIVGPARGSTCGSLVCYLLDITAIDPIPFGLIFERFIDTTRADLPDADLDFSDQRRQLVFDYAEQKYGRDRVARLGNVMTFQPRTAMKAAGAALRVPGWKIEKVLDGVIERSGGDSRALQTLEDTLKDTEAGRMMISEFPEIIIAGRMEGHPNNASQHAAGIVITDAPVMDFVAVDHRTRSAMCDKYDAEALNLLKIDALGLTQLSIFERTLQLIGKPDVSGYLETLPLDDPAAFDVLNKGNFAGVFQFMGGALKSLTKQFKITHIEDMIAITALARPGPMATGGANSWVKRKTGREQISYPHPLLEPYLKDTLGIVIYQEQVLRIGREIGDLSWGDVTQLRKAMSKSLGEEFFDKWGDPWKKAAVAKGIPQDVVNKFWKDLCGFGSWAFNRSHSVAYGIVSYWCCWLKAHHPLEFAAATLDTESDPARQIALLRELALEGIDYVPVDPEHSTDKWEIVKKGNKQILVGPLTQIKGIGPATVQEILAARKNKKQLRASLKERLALAKTEIDTLFPIRDAIQQHHPDLKKIGIVSTPTLIKDIQCGVNGEVVALAVANKIAPKDENEAVNIAKRGYKLTGPTQALNLFIRDDTDEIFAKVNRRDFEKLGRPIVERGRVGKALYAVKGSCPASFRMISITNVKFLGFIDD